MIVVRHWSQSVFDIKFRRRLRGLWLCLRRSDYPWELFINVARLFVSYQIYQPLNQDTPSAYATAFKIYIFSSNISPTEMQMWPLFHVDHSYSWEFVSSWSTMQIVLILQIRIVYSLLIWSSQDTRNSNAGLQFSREPETQKALCPTAATHIFCALVKLVLVDYYRT